MFKEGGENVSQVATQRCEFVGSAHICPCSARLNQRHAVPLYIHTVMLRLFALEVSVIEPIHLAYGRPRDGVSWLGMM